MLEHPERFVGYVASGIVHPLNPPRTMLRELPRFLYQPPIAAPVLGPRMIPRIVTRFLRAGWGDRETYDRAAEPIYAEPLQDHRGAASNYYRQFLVHEVLRGPRGRLTIPTRLLQGRQDPIGTAMATGSSATVTTRGRSCSTAAATSSRGATGEVARAVASLPWS